MLLTNAQFQKVKSRKTSRYLNDGSQTNAFLCKSKIVIYAGNRGNGKTHLILNKILPYINMPEYRCVYMRKEVKDANGAGGIVDASRGVFSQFGQYLESQSNMVWKFQSGARASFMNYSPTLKEFQEAIQGKEYAHIFIDEITHIEEAKFNALFANLRTTYGIKTQIFGTCNADADSWISNLIEWYIDPDTGFHIPERDGKERFFFQYGNTISEAIWGDSREEVYELAKDYIAPFLDKKMLKHNSPLDVIMSISVFEGKMSENERIMKSGGGGVEYLGQLLKGSTEMKNRYARACWKKIDMGDSKVSEADMLRFFNNSEQTNGTKYASMDVAGEGTDKVTLWIWNGRHIENVYMAVGLKAKALYEWTVRHLNQEGVQERNFVYDAIGVGFAFSGYFDDAVKFISNASVSEASKVNAVDKKMIKIYANAKAELIGSFLEILNNYNDTGECGISINPELLHREFYGKTLKQHLLHERKAIRWRSDKDGVLQCIDKKETRSVIGHSADIIFGLMYRLALDIGHKQFIPMTEKTKVNLNKFFLKY
jgi:hypothetical protein